MTQRFHMPLAEPLPLGSEVVWNGSFDRAEAYAHRVPCPPRSGHQVHLHAGVVDPATAVPDAGSSRPCDRILAYLGTHTAVVHTSLSVATALSIDVRNTSTWLRRFTKRGVLQQQAREPDTIYGGKGRYVYRVRAVPLS